jgi:hypothetical protein
MITAQPNHLFFVPESGKLPTRLGDILLSSDFLNQPELRGIRAPLARCLRRSRVSHPRKSASISG